jgi:GT2 family glycosyltransferase
VTADTGTPVTATAETAPPPLPRGFGVTLDGATKELSDGSLFGGSPARLLRLTAAGQRALTELRAGPIRSAAAAVLARRLTDAGLAHPVPTVGAAGGSLDVTILIPVRDRAGLLDRCLAAVAGRYPVVVVDDGSADESAVARIAALHGASVLRRDRCGGPAAARNAGLAAIETELVAFLDSDCVPPAGWIDALAPHLADPLVAAVAPRIVTVAQRSAVARYEQVRSSLDLGDQAARVVPGGRVAYVPTAALLVRRAALDEVPIGSRMLGTGTPGVETPAPDGRGDVFDPALRYGEDVDLIWRLHAAGWRIRYEPVVRVPHESPATWPGLLARRFHYGTSAAALARRHPANLAPLVLQPWPAATVFAGLARRPAVAAAGTVAAWLDITAAVRRAGVPADGAPGAALTSIRQAWLGVGRYAGQFAAPVLVTALAAPGRKRAGRRAAAASLLLGPALAAYAERRPRLDPVRYALAHIADDVCYGAGVWVGCLRERTIVPVTPVISWRPVRVTRPPGGELPAGGPRTGGPRTVGRPTVGRQADGSDLRDPDLTHPQLTERAEPDGE